MHRVRVYPRAIYTRLAKRDISRVPLTTYCLNGTPRARCSQRRFSISSVPQVRFRDVSTRSLGKGSTRSALLILLGMGAAVAAALQYGFIEIKVEHIQHDSATHGNRLDVSALLTVEDIALLAELNRYHRQFMFYIDKDSEETFKALEKIVRFMDRHPELLDPVSSTGLAFREGYVDHLIGPPRHADFLRETAVLITHYERRLKEYDRRGILNLPLQRDLLLFLDEPKQDERGDAGTTNMSDSEQRKCIFQGLWKAYNSLVIFYTRRENPHRNDEMANESIAKLLSAMEAEFGPHFERAPLLRRAGSIEIDKVFILGYMKLLRTRFAQNTSPTYLPELALRCLSHLTDLWQDFEAAEDLSPCYRISAMQSIAELVLDLACESAPEGLLITDEDRQHLDEAKRIQQRVLELAADVEPTKRERLCDSACAQGLISMAKIAWRYGDEVAGDQQLTKAAKLVDSGNFHLLKEVIRRIDKDPTKTQMKHWEPVDGEECKRLWDLDRED